MFLKFITIEELLGKPKPPPISFWYFVDAIFLAFLTGFGLIVATRYVFGDWVAVFAGVLFLCMPLFRQFYKKTKPAPKPLKIFGYVFRSMLLLACIIIYVSACFTTK